MAAAPSPQDRPPAYRTGADEDRRTARSVNPLLLWLGILGGPIAYGLVRLAGIVLVVNSCRHGSGSPVLLGLSGSQTLMVAITTLCALVALASGLLAWHSWRRLRGETERRSGESTRAGPFWALGGIFLSAIFFAFIVATGGLALGLSTACA